MFVTTTKRGYTSSGEQFAHGEFLILMQGESEKYRKLKGVVRFVKMSQFGHFMMGSAKLGDYQTTLSGSYGSDGLPETVPDDVYCRFGLELPDELYDAWNNGGGHNSAGSEAVAMRKWALENLKELKATPRKKSRNWVGSPNLDGMDEEDLRGFYRSMWDRPMTEARVMFPGKGKEAMDAVKQLRQYASLSLEARTKRTGGDIPWAMRYEELAQETYEALPEWARW